MIKKIVVHPKRVGMMTFLGLRCIAASLESNENADYFYEAAQQNLEKMGKIRVDRKNPKEMVFVCVETMSVLTKHLIQWMVEEGKKK